MPQPVKATAADRPFTVGETHGILLRPEHRIHASSDRLGWTSLYASTQREPAFEDEYAAVPDHMIVLHLDGPVTVSRILGDSLESRLIPPSGLFILPGGMDFGVRLEGELSTVHIYIRHSIVEEVAADLAGTDCVELVPRLGERDQLIEQLALETRYALTSADAGCPTYVDYLARAIAARLIRGHSTLTIPSPAKVGGLTRIQLDRAIEFMSVYLDRSLTLPGIAEAVGLSATHFARRFKQSTAQSPHQYLMRLRIARAKHLLAETDEAIAQIAIACGFTHQEHLTRVFRDLSGDTPGRFRRTARR